MHEVERTQRGRLCIEQQSAARSMKRTMANSCRQPITSSRHQSEHGRSHSLAPSGENLTLRIVGRIAALDPLRALLDRTPQSLLPFFRPLAWLVVRKPSAGFKSSVRSWPPDDPGIFRAHRLEIDAHVGPPDRARTGPGDSEILCA